MSEDTPFLPSLPEAALAQQVRTDRYRYLAPFLARLYQSLDLRLVRTAHQCVAALLCLRNRSPRVMSDGTGYAAAGWAACPSGGETSGTALSQPSLVGRVGRAVAPGASRSPGRAGRRCGPGCF